MGRRSSCNNNKILSYNIAKFLSVMDSIVHSILAQTETALHDETITGAKELFI